jgi:peptidoglycan-associated lipoprotein
MCRRRRQFFAAIVPASIVVLLASGCAKEPATARVMAPGTLGSTAGIAGDAGDAPSRARASAGIGSDVAGAGTAGGGTGVSASGRGGAQGGNRNDGAVGGSGRAGGQDSGSVVGGGQDGAQLAASVQAAARPEPAEFQPAAEIRDIYFDFDRYAIRPDAAKTLTASAQWLRNHPEDLILIEGHSDERGTSDYNIALGQHRSESAKNFLVAQGIQASRVTVISYGEERPVCLEQTETCWAKNRRAHFLVKRP